MIMAACPNDLDERMELYCLHRLGAAQEREFEAHLAVCPACMRELLDTELFIESLVLALKETDQSFAAHCRKMYS
jgi:anti-sigma factor RsiW